MESAARELLYKILLAVKFAQYGHECYIGSKNEIYRLFPQVRPFIYFDKGYHVGKSEKLFENVRENDGLIVSLDEEGGVDFKHAKTIVARYPEEIFNYCDLVFIWGEKQYNLLRSNRQKFDMQRTILSGHPRFELLKPKFHSFYRFEAEQIKKRFGKYFLVNTNMGFGNNIRGEAFVRRNYGDRISNIGKIIEFDLKKLKQIIAFVCKLSTQTDEAIVLRPHPEENQQVYKKSFRNHANVHVVYEGSVIPWLVGAEAMIHPDCTTGIESRMVGKIPLSLLPERNNELCTYATVEVSKSFLNEDTLINFLLEGRYSNRTVDPDVDFLQQYFAYNLDSSDIILREVLDLISGHRVREVRDVSVPYICRRIVNNQINNIKAMVSCNGSYLLQQNKLAGFSESDVRMFVEKFNKEYSDRGPARVQKINKYLHRIFV